MENVEGQRGPIERRPGDRPPRQGGKKEKQKIKKNTGLDVVGPFFLTFCTTFFCFFFFFSKDPSIMYFHYSQGKVSKTSMSEEQLSKNCSFRFSEISV